MVNQTNLPCSLGVNAVGSKNQFHRRGIGYLVGQIVDSWVRADPSYLWLGEAEFGFLSRDSYIAGYRQVKTPAQAPAMNSGNQWLPHFHIQEGK